MALIVGATLNQTTTDVTEVRFYAYLVLMLSVQGVLLW